MSAAVWIVGWGLIATGAAAIAGILASVRNRDYSFWIAWTFIFPPMLLILATLPPFKGERPKRRSLDEEDQHDRFL
ncbi:MAG: hypothetical protein AAFO75_06385 [Pseudomonadota bacterium]